MSLQLGLVYTIHFSWNWFSYWVHHPFGGTDARNPWLVMDETSRSSHELFGCPRFSGKIGVGSVGTMIDEYWWYVYICFIFFTLYGPIWLYKDRPACRLCRHSLHSLRCSRPITAYHSYVLKIWFRQVRITHGFLTSQSCCWKSPFLIGNHQFERSLIGNHQFILYR